MATEGDVKNTLDALVQLRTGVEPQGIGSGQRLKAARRDLRTAPGWAAAESVVAFGLGEKTTQGREVADVALKVYVDKKRPLSALDAPVPKTVALAGQPVPTDVVEIGRIEIQSNTAKVRPALPGFSISRLGDDPNTGTFGLIVRKKGQPKPFYLLSNNHAIAASGLAQKGDVIIQPGAYDGGGATDRIGTLVEWVPFDFSAAGTPNVVDAAIAQLDDDVASAAISLLGIPTGINTDVKRGTFVQKMGRTTELSVAQVRDVDLFLPVPYPAAGGAPPLPPPGPPREQCLI